MPLSNFAQLRRVRSEMSAEAGHDVRRFIELLGEIRQKHETRLINHGVAETHISMPESMPSSRAPIPTADQ